MFSVGDELEWVLTLGESEAVFVVIMEAFPADIIADETDSDGLVLFGEWRGMGCSLELLS